MRDFREGILADGIADVLRDIAARLEERTAEAVEYRTRLELTARAHSTAEEERRRLLEDLARERDRADRAEEARALRNLLEAVMNSIRNVLGMRKTGGRGRPSQPENPRPDAGFTQVHNTL